MNGIKELKVKEWLLKHAYYIIIGVFCLKFVLLFWSAHPFDFNAFVQTINRHAVYGWNVFEYWNKGNFLILLWYPLYAVYLVFLQITHLPVDQIWLLHFVFKYPFFIMDIICALLIFGLSLKLTLSQESAKIASLLWVFNPIIFYVYGIHGHYELLVAFSLLLTFFSLAYDLPILFGFAFAIAFSTKYFIIVLAPLFLIYLIVQKKYSFIFKGAVTGILTLVLSYIHFFFEPELLQQTLHSILILSQAWVTTGNPTITIPDMNIFSVAHIFIGQGPITNTGSPVWFWLANQSFIFISLFCIFIYIRTIYRSVRAQFQYSLMSLFEDSFLLLAGFVILLTNFQWHYVIWFLPFFIIIATTNEFMLSLFSVITTAGFFLFFKNEYGPRTFFIDLVKDPHFSTISSMSPDLLHLLPFFIIISFTGAVIYLVTHQNKKTSQKSKPAFMVIAYISLIIWIVISYSYGQIIYQYIREPQKQTVMVDQLVQRGEVGRVYESSLVTGSQTEFAFEHAVTDKALIVEGVLPYLERGDTTTFSSNITFPNAPELVTKDGPAFLYNDCYISLATMRPIKNIIDGTISLGIPVPLTCLKYTNTFTILTPEKWYSPALIHPQLYIVSNPTKDLFGKNQATLIYILSFIGIFFFIGGAFVFRKCLEALKEEYE